MNQDFEQTSLNTNKKSKKINITTENQNLINRVLAWQKPIKKTLDSFSEFHRKEDLLSLYDEVVKSSLEHTTSYIATSRLISELNFHDRGAYFTLNELSADTDFPEIGDIYFFDFGMQYNLETSYVHPGLVLNVHKEKIEVACITTNASKFKESLNPSRIHLIPFPKEEDVLPCDSTIMLDDVRWINATRLVCYGGSIDPQGELFQKILRNRQQFQLQPNSPDISQPLWKVKPIEKDSKRNAS